MPCRAGSAVYFQRVPYLRGDFRYGFFIFIGNTVIHSCVKVEPSYEIKNAPRGCAARGKENIALRTASTRNKSCAIEVSENREVCEAHFCSKMRLNINIIDNIFSIKYNEAEQKKFRKEERKK